MIFIHIGTYNPPAKWLEKAEELSERLAELQNGAAELTEDAKDVLNRKTIWTELKEDLEYLSFGKCWYSEAREKVSYYHVDHFRPKKRSIDSNGSKNNGYWWLAYDWKNYRISGSVINNSKRDKFAVYSNRASNPETPIEDELIYLLDPVNKDDVSLLTFNENGEAMPLNPSEDAWEHKRAKYTIETLDLNIPKLVRARKIKWQDIVKTIKSIQELQQKNNQNPSASLQTQLRALKDQTRQLISPMNELSSTYRACLRASREDWAISILQEPFDIERLQQEYREV